MWESGSDIGPRGDPANQEAAASQPPVFVCPSAPRYQPEKEHKDYGINGGTSCCAERGTGAPADGITWVNAYARLADITDGISNTFAFHEFAHFGNHSFCDYKKGCNPFFYVHHESEGYVVSNNDTSGYPPTPPNCTMWNARAAHSAHPDGVQASKCDGSVFFVSNYVDFAVYRDIYQKGRRVPAR